MKKMPGPYLCHKARKIHIDCRDTLEKELKRDVRLGVLKEVPVNTPTTWTSRMVITTKKSGNPR